MDEILDWPSWPLVAGIFVAMFIANEIGFRLGNHLHRDETEKSRFASGALKASVFGMVALLIGFSFSLTASRHEMRRKVVLDEANAIDVCYLRAGLLENPMQSQIRETLRMYLAVRMEHFQNLLNPPEHERTRRDMDRLLDDVWRTVEETNQKNRESIRTSLIVPAANAVIDMNATRAWSVQSHMPGAVLSLLFVCVMVSSLLIGHSSGQSGRRHLWLWVSTNLLFALVLYVMLEFDRPRRGAARVEHAPLIDLQSRLAEDARRSASP